METPAGGVSPRHGAEIFPAAWADSAGICRLSPAAALLIIGVNAVEKILEAERADGAGLSHRLVLAHLPRVLRADGRAHRALDEQPRAGHAGRLRLHEHAPQAPRRREAALHRRRLRVGRAHLPPRAER